MAARQYVTIAGTQYSKGKFCKKWTEIVKSCEIGVELSGSDLEFFLDSAGRLNHYAAIIAKGHPRVKVVNRRFNGKLVKGLVFITPNSGVHVWIGKQQVVGAIFPQANRPDPAKLNRKRALAAMRNIVQPQIDSYKQRIRNKGLVRSSETGKPILGTYHVDHVYPFIRLVEEWCRENSLDLETLPVKCRGVRCGFQSVELSESWFDYHALHAEFQVLDVRENLSKGSRYFGRGKKSLEDD